ncbi:MAG: precorrin-2 C(20)-methyltransferase [Deltaproteobacteria bacterium]|nr:precorrin-2 C(20)-methyltransferase [Deltaproteobacteria bacterium]MBZ0219597.1 precorrin-2 C(20)-methyltransferase [Deltaproteobacteria bacterium]
MIKPGVFYGVGVGPGDPELMTIKAVRVIGAAGVLAVPKSEGGDESLALSIVRKAVDLGGKKILELPFPMTRDPEALRESRKSAARLISDRLREGVDAAFVTLGDPLIYSTFSYLMPFVKELSPGSEIRVVPGVASFSASAAALPASLAETAERVIIIPAAYELDKVREALGSAETIVLMKVNRAVDGVIDLLTEAGLLERSFFVSRAGWPEEKLVTDLRALKGGRPDYFSMIIVRKNA